MLLDISSFLKENKTAIMFISMAVLLISLILVSVIYFLKKNKIRNRGENIRHMTSIAIFATLSIILYLTLKFNLPIFPSFLKINFSNLPIIIGGFLLGPVEGMIIIIIRTIIVLPFSGTFFVGELADLIISSIILLSSSIFYAHHKTKKGANVAIIIAFFTWVIGACLANYFILVPAYVTLFFGGNVNAFISMISVIKGVNEENYLIKYILFGALPFNALLSLVVCIITYLIYKRLSKFFHIFDKKIYKEEQDTIEEK